MISATGWGSRRGSFILLLSLGATPGCTSGDNVEAQLGVGTEQQAFSNQVGGADPDGTHCVSPLGNCLPIHEDITVEALAFLEPNVRNYIARSNAAYDASHVVDARAHFDNCTFALSSQRISERYASAVGNALSFPSGLSCPTYFLEDCSASGETASLQDFAAVLHGLQDFYAHTNWVEILKASSRPLTLVDANLGAFPPIASGDFAQNGNAVFIGDSNFAGQWGIVPPRGNAVYPDSVMPRACKHGSCFYAIISGKTVGTFQSVPHQCPSQVRILHDADLAKDGPNTTRYFAEARLLARQQTAHEWCRFVSLVRAQHQQVGDWALYDNWVADVVPARCGPDVDMVGKAVSFPPTDWTVDPYSFSTYELQVSNLGASQAYGVTWEAHISGSVALVGTATMGGAPCEVLGTSVTCRASAPLQPGASLPVVVPIIAAAPGTFDISVGVSSHNPDLNDINDEAESHFVVECPAITPRWNDATLQCEECPIGQSWDEVTRECVSNTTLQVYVTSAGADVVGVVNVNNGSLIDEVSVGRFPAGIALLPNGTVAYVANFLGNSVSVIDTKTNSVLTTIPVGGGPFGVAARPDGTAVYVANQSSNSVSVIDPLTNSVVGTLPGGSCPRGVAVTPAGTSLVIASQCDARVLTVDLGNGAVSSITVQSVPSYVALAPDGTLAYIGHQSSRASLTTINLEQQVVVDSQIFGSGGGGWLTVAPDGIVYLPIVGGLQEVGGTSRFFSGTTSGVAVTPDGATLLRIGLARDENNVNIHAVVAYDRASASVRFTTPITIVSQGSLGGIAVGPIPH